MIMASRRKHTSARGTRVKALLVCAWGFDDRAPQADRERALREIEELVPEVKLFMLPDAHGEMALWCYVEQGDFETIPEILRSQANHIEEVRKDGSGVVYKSEDVKRGPIEKTTLPGYNHPKPPTAWERVLDVDD